MKNTFTKLSIYCTLFVALSGTVNAQSSDTAAVQQFVPSGKLWGYAFGDYAFKGNADTSTKNGGRGNNNQYSKVPANANFFQWRRIYLGYNYNISEKFSAEFLLAAEDNPIAIAGSGTTAGNPGQSTSGDQLADSKFSPYIKIANIRWKNIWKGSDLAFGQMNTPAFAKTGRNDQTSEEIWAYRSVERTISDIRRTPSFDFGLSLQGWFDKTGNFGYDMMMANGTSAKPAANNFKWFYGDVYAKFLNKRLIVQLYQDYERLLWNPMIVKTSGAYHSERDMTKLFIAWNDKKFTVGTEIFQNTILGGVSAVGAKDGNTYYRTTQAIAFSLFARGRIYKDQLGFFARYDNYDASKKLNEVTDGEFKSYATTQSNYDPTTKEQFVTFGLDYTPVKNVHIMPNVWMNTYDCALGSSQYGLNTNGTGVKGTDVVYRLTLYYIYK